MSSLMEQLAQSPKREAVVRDACTVLNQEVADKGGLSGLAIKGAFKLLEGIKPGFVTEVVDALLNDFLTSLDPIYQEALERQVKPGAHLTANGSRVADALLQVTDRKAEHATRQAIKKTYEKLRPTAKKHVESAVPRLAQLLERHAAS
ncbi:MAG: hypothetical protein SFV15_18875 [Polyangiaceae bacterium]|nr:hypothetical protein [Polyangiaceae bacterium]